MYILLYYFPIVSISSTVALKSFSISLSHLSLGLSTSLLPSNLLQTFSWPFLPHPLSIFPDFSAQFAEVLWEGSEALCTGWPDLARHQWTLPAGPCTVPDRVDRVPQLHPRHGASVPGSPAQLYSPQCHTLCGWRSALQHTTGCSEYRVCWSVYSQEHEPCKAKYV